MFGSPGFSKPEHQYGQSFGDQAEVLDGGGALTSEVVIPAGSLSVGDRIRIQVSGTLTPEQSEELWPGEGFGKPVQDFE